ncbi:MAG TPA: family 1 glycosylhydrolase [Tepidisphaeraceae bacterium]|jgi:beta-glucosidase/6-phospho-beta-glucosidase/beta-galactosidase
MVGAKGLDSGQDENGNMPSTQVLMGGVDSLPFDQFIFGSGIECSFLPHINVNQFQWTQHDRYWRDDFKRAREELGITHLRYAFPWHELEPQRGAFNWGYSDERIAECDRLGIKLMLDVMHFGTPMWLKQAVGDPEFPEALEEYAEALVGRYRNSVNTWCPFNEPLVSALFSGDFGFWPPHSRKWRGYMPVLSRIVQATSRSIRAIRRMMPEATVLLCDAAENFKTRTPALHGEVDRRNLRRFVVMDLLTGRVDRHHPLFPWLTSYGMSELDIDWLRANPQAPDVLGLDYYPHSDWQVESENGAVRQRRADNPIGVYGLGTAYYNRYGIPLMLTETSVDGKPINREIWLDTTLDHIRRLREEGIPMLGMIWWPMIDQLDWDGALTHRIGKIHNVGLYSLNRQKDGALQRTATQLVSQFKEAMAAGEARVGKLETIALPARVEDVQLPPLGEWATPTQFELLPLNDAIELQPGSRMAIADAKSTGNGNGANKGKTNGNGNGHAKAASRLADPAPGLAAEPGVSSSAGIEAEIHGLEAHATTSKQTDRYGIVVFSHLRWGFVWQRPQQFLSRFARKHQILFIEEPLFDKPAGTEPDLTFHRVMPNVTVVAPHVDQTWNRNPKLPQKLLEWTRQAIAQMNENGEFDRPLLWYYSPMDSAWSLGQIENRGVIYDSMDELSQFSGAPRALVDNENRLMECADVVFAGGYELAQKKKKRHANVHFFGCGVEYSHFSLAQDPSTNVPPDIDFMSRPILGWFGVVDERVDYNMVGEMARMRPGWSFAMVGPVVKVDPNLLPHFPNLYWLGQRDYSVLPNYCRAFDICTMPFAINAATEYINPTKALEYLATGRPVIGTPVKDVVRQYSDLVEIVKTPEQFVEAAERLLKTPDTDRIQRGIDKARECSWESTVQQMQSLIKEAISKKGRPSSRKITPMDDAELEYVFQATQGS